MRSKRDARQGQLSAGRKRRGQPHDLLDCCWIDRRLAGRKSDEGRGIWCAGRHHPRDTRRHRWWLALWVAWHLARRRDHRVHPRCLCRRSDYGVDRAEVEKGEERVLLSRSSHGAQLEILLLMARCYFRSAHIYTKPPSRVLAKLEEGDSLHVKSP